MDKGASPEDLPFSSHAEGIAKDLNSQWSAVLGKSTFGEGVLHVTYVIGSFSLGYLANSADAASAVPLVGLFLMAMLYGLANVCFAQLGGLTDMLRQFRAMHDHAMVSKMNAIMNPDAAHTLMALYGSKADAVESVINMRRFDHTAHLRSIFVRYLVFLVPPAAGAMLGA